MIWIGIDTGTETGVALWDDTAKRLRFCESGPIHRVMKEVHDFYKWRHLPEEKITVVFEDARLRKWYGTTNAKEDRDKLQGAGSVKRDCRIWEDALRDWGIPFLAVAPKDNMTKLSAEAFRRLTGWTGRTNEHMRDAAMLVYGR